MRVLTFLHSFEPGGVERVALRLVRSWREQGMDAPLFMGRDHGAMSGDVGRGLDFVMPGQPGISTAPFETLWMILTLPRAVRALRPDVLFCAGNSYTVVAVALKLLLGRRCPPIVAKISNDLDRRDMPRPLRSLYRAWLRLQGRFLDHLVGMEEPMRSEIAEAMRRPARDVSIVPDPALSARIIGSVRARPRGEPASKGRRFVAVSRLVAQKNLKLMLRAFARAACVDDHLTIFGDGPQRAVLTALADQLGIAARVTFRGHVPQPVDHLSDFDILLLSSDYEGVPAAVLEALAANLLVVATDCSRSMRSLLQDGRLGLLTAVGDERAFAEAIATARSRDQDPARSLAQAARFTIERASAAYWQCFEKAAHRPCVIKLTPELRLPARRAVSGPQTASESGGWTRE